MKSQLACLALVAAAAFLPNISKADDAAAAKPMEPSRVREILMSDDDKKFVATAASAGTYEVQAGKVAQQKATDPALKDFAQHMIDDHTKANDELTALAQKKNITVSQAPASDDQKLLDKLNKAKPGKDFNKTYRSQMVSTHKKAVSLFDNESRNGKDADIKSWAAATLPKLEEHGGMAKALKKKAS